MVKAFEYQMILESIMGYKGQTFYFVMYSRQNSMKYYLVIKRNEVYVTTEMSLEDMLNERRPHI